MKLDVKKVDLFMFLIAIGWLLVIGLTLAEKGFMAMYVSAGIISLHFLIGLAHNGSINKKLFISPFLSWITTFLIGIVGMQYFAFLYGDSVPSFLILGMHPSYFFELAFYWIAGIFTISLGMYKQRDLWLSEEDWKCFLDAVNSDREGTRNDE